MHAAEEVRRSQNLQGAPAAARLARASWARAAPAAQRAAAAPGAARAQSAPAGRRGAPPGSAHWPGRCAWQASPALVPAMLHACIRFLDDKQTASVVVSDVAADFIKSPMNVLAQILLRHGIDSSACTCNASRSLSFYACCLGLGWCIPAVSVLGGTASQPYLHQDRASTSSSTSSRGLLGR